MRKRGKKGGAAATGSLYSRGGGRERRGSSLECHAARGEGGVQRCDCGGGGAPTGDQDPATMGAGGAAASSAR
jgi:hypothetical protein